MRRARQALGVVAGKLGGAALVLASAVGAFALVSTSSPPTEALAKSASPKEGFAPDPPPVASKKQWTFTIGVKDSVPSLEVVTAIELDKAVATPRVMGRFAVEFIVGTELLDRHRFDVPLNGDGPRDRDEAGRKRPTFRVNTTVFVRLADHARTTQVRLVDRATGETTRFLWPPNADGTLTKIEPAAPTPSGSADAGPPAPPPSAKPSAAPSTQPSVKPAQPPPPVPPVPGTP